MRIYISGPIKIDPETAPQRFADAANVIALQGDRPINPFDCEPICVGHYNLNVWAEPDKHYDCHMRGDIVALMDCHAIVMLDKWWLSKGAAIEFNIATQLNMKIFPSLVYYVAEKLSS